MKDGSTESSDADAPQTASAVSSETLFVPLGINAPQRIGQYTLKRIIGSGSFGTVYEAMQDHPRRPVALKVMRRLTGAPNATSLRRFQFEAEILGRLHHPGIAQVYEAGMFDDGLGATPFFVLEYIANAKTITQYAVDNKLTIRDRLKLFSQVCDAVYQPNLQGIVHRDLKPANILVDAGGHPKVIDFGVARATDSDLAVASQQTNVGELVGTLAYMSPEQIDADPHDIDIRSDVYSLGVVLYELLTGTLPHDVRGLASHHAAHMIREHTPKRISAHNPALRGDIETIVHTALHKDRHWRYQTAAELCDNINRFLSGQPILERRPTLRSALQTHQRAFVRRHPVASLAIAAALAFAITEFMAVPIFYRWTNLYHWYSQAMESAVRRQDVNDPFEHVRMLQITPQTASVISDVAREQGVSDVEWDNRASLRKTHGLLARKLVGTGVRCLSYDITFGVESEYDNEFCEGIEALRADGVDVVAGYKLHEDGRIRCSSIIAPHVKLGWCGAAFDDHQWHLDTAFVPANGEPMPSLALTTMAASQSPQKNIALRLRNQGLAEVLVYESDHLMPHIRRNVEAKHTLQLSAVNPYQLQDRSSDVEFVPGIQQGDIAAISTFAVPSEQVFKTATFEYEWALCASPDELRNAFKDKIVVVGYAHPEAEPFSNPPTATPQPRMYVHALAIERFMRGQGFRGEWDFPSRVGMALAALLGVAGASLPWSRLARRSQWRIEPAMRHLLTAFAIIIALAAGLIVCGIIYGSAGILFNPVIPLICLVLAAALAVRVQRVRLSNSM